jgi:hypothetical protein
MKHFLPIVVPLPGGEIPVVPGPHAGYIAALIVTVSVAFIVAGLLMARSRARKITGVDDGLLSVTTVENHDCRCPICG